MGPVPHRFSIVQCRSDPEIVKSLETLLALAKEGKIIGLAYVALKPANDYQGDLAGKALTHPVLALGLARALEDQITRLLR